MHIRSESGPQHCIIQCGDRDLAIAFLRGETSDTVFEGFTILNANNVAAIWILRQSDPTIKNCILTRNRTSAIDSSDSSPTILNCIVTHNYDDYSPALYFYGGSPKVVNTLVQGNGGTGISHSGRGGGILIENCRIIENYAGVWLARGTNRVVNTIIAGNERYGAGVSYEAGAQFINSVIVDNEIGVYPDSYNNPVVTNSIVRGNREDQFEGSSNERVIATSRTSRGDIPAKATSTRTQDSPPTEATAYFSTRHALTRVPMTRLMDCRRTGIW